MSDASGIMLRKQLENIGVKYLFHFTDKRNIDSIRCNGLLAYSRIQSLCINSFRCSSQLSIELDRFYGLDKYVHLCFNQNHPMYSKMKYFEKRDIIWLGVKTEVLEMCNIKITTDVANKNGIKLLSINEAIKTIDFGLIYKLGWSNANQNNKYEILVENEIPLYLTTIKR